MLGDHPLELLVWLLMTPLILGAVVGVFMGLGFAIVAAMGAVNHGVSVLVRHTVAAVKTRGSTNSDGAPPRLP